MEPKKRKQLCLDIDQTTHGYIKIYAAEKRITMNYWLMDAINDALAKQDIERDK